MKPHRYLITLFFGFFLYPGWSQNTTDVYKAGDNGYQCFRIPTIVKTKSGTLLAFAEARKNGCGDAGNIDIVLRRSNDNGVTWSDMIIVWDDKTNTCGNPAPVVDERTGKVLLLSTWNDGQDHESQIIHQTSKDTRRVFVLHSNNEGSSWSSPKEITENVKAPNWTWYATGPCNGIQMKTKKFRGRLIVPCDHIEAGSKKYFSHVIFSDDGGLTWMLGGSTPTDQVNESTVAELPNGELMLNMRNYNKTRARRISISRNGGLQWSALYTDSTLIEPVCQGSLLAYTRGRSDRQLVFSNPASTSVRENMTVRFSKDNGKNWYNSVLIKEGPAAYSNLVQMADGQIGCLFETGEKSAYESIVFKRVIPM